MSGLRDLFSDDQARGINDTNELTCDVTRPAAEAADVCCWWIAGDGITYPAHDGSADFEAMVRGTSDAERVPREERKGMQTAWVADKKRYSVDEWRAKILAALADDARTFNDICVRTNGYTADVMCGTAAQAALHELFNEGVVGRSCSKTYPVWWYVEREPQARAEPIRRQQEQGELFTR